MEWFILIVSISILCTHNIGMSVSLGLPRSFIKKLRVVLETRGDGAPSIALIKIVVMFNILHWSLGVGIWFSSVIGLEIGFSETCGPLFIEAGMWG